MRAEEAFILPGALYNGGVDSLGATRAGHWCSAEVPGGSHPSAFRALSFQYSFQAAGPGSYRRACKLSNEMRQGTRAPVGSPVVGAVRERTCGARPSSRSHDALKSAAAQQHREQQECQQDSP